MGKITKQELSQELKDEIENIEIMHRGLDEPELSEEEKRLGGQLWLKG